MFKSSQWQVKNMDLSLKFLVILSTNKNRDGSRHKVNTKRVQNINLNLNIVLAES